MLEILEFIFSGFWTWLGTCILLFISVFVVAVFHPLAGFISANKQVSNKGVKKDEG